MGDMVERFLRHTPNESSMEARLLISELRHQLACSLLNFLYLMEA
jgi:hypothetical protein